MARTVALSLFLLSLSLLQIGCGSTQKRISGTDLPTMPRVSLTSSEVTDSKGGVATAGKFVFAGPVYDALERLRWISRAYVDAGWTPERPEGTPSKASQIFTKPAPKLNLTRSVRITTTASRATGSILAELYSEPTASE